MNSPNTPFDPYNPYQSPPPEYPRYNEPLPDTNQPVAPMSPPPVVGWYRAYCIVMVLLYIVCAVGGAVLIAFSSQWAAATQTSSLELLINGVVLLGSGVVMLGVCLAALFLPNRPWVWIYHMVVIGIGLTSCCTWPATIPLLIAWIKPETQRYFGRDTSPPPPPNPNVPPPPIPSI